MGTKKTLHIFEPSTLSKTFFHFKKMENLFASVYDILYMMTDENCFWILISREVCVIIVQTHMMTSSDGVIHLIKVFSHVFASFI